MRAHADFPPSSAQRNFDCPASWALNRKEPDTNNLDSELGTFAHEIAERCFANDCDAVEWLGETKDVVVKEKHHTLVCDAEMVANVQKYLDWCRA